MSKNEFYRFFVNEQKSNSLLDAPIQILTDDRLHGRPR